MEKRIDFEDIFRICFFTVFQILISCSFILSKRLPSSDFGENQKIYEKKLVSGEVSHRKIGMDEFESKSMHRMESVQDEST